MEKRTPHELYRLKLTEDERARLRAINQRRECERQERARLWRVEENAPFDELRAAGYPVESVWHLWQKGTAYPEAIPILLRHLQLDYSDRTRAGIARALAVPDPEVRKAWPLLVEEFRKARDGKGSIAPGDTKQFSLGFKDGLACALSAAVTKETLPELIALASDPSQGTSRVILLTALRPLRKKDPRVKEAIEHLANDPDLAKEIAAWRK